MVDRKEIRERKGVCGGCGSPLRSLGEIEGDERGEELECTSEHCGYVEWRLYGDGYYEHTTPDERLWGPDGEQE